MSEVSHVPRVNKQRRDERANAVEALLKRVRLAGRLRSNRDVVSALKGFLDSERPEDLIPAGDWGAQSVRLRPADVRDLTDRQQLSLIRGTMAILDAMVRRDRDVCICRMPPLVTVTIAALAVLLAHGAKEGRLAYQRIRKSTLLCADRIGLQHSHCYEDFILCLAGPTDERDVDFGAAEKLAARRILDSYRNWLRGEAEEMRI